MSDPIRDLAEKIYIRLISNDRAKPPEECVDDQELACDAIYAAEEFELAWVDFNDPPASAE